MLLLGYCLESDGEEPQATFAKLLKTLFVVMQTLTTYTTFPFQKPQNMSPMFSIRPDGLGLMTLLASLSIVDVTEGHAFLAVPMSRNWRVSGRVVECKTKAARARST